MDEEIKRLGLELETIASQARSAIYRRQLGLSLSLRTGNLSQAEYLATLNAIQKESFDAYYRAFFSTARTQARILGKTVPLRVLDEGRRLANEFAERSRLSAIRTLAKGYTPRQSASIISNASRTFAVKTATSLTADTVGNAKRKRVVRIRGVLTPRPEHQKLEGRSYGINTLINIDGYLVRDFTDPKLPKSSTFGCGHTVVYTR